jgi:competence protein ComEA
VTDPAPPSGGELPPFQGTWRERIEVLTAGSPMTPVRLLAVVVGVVIAAVVALVVLRQPSLPPPELALPLAGSASDPATTSTTAAPEVTAHAAGAVVAPGVYRLRPGARVADLVQAAGGAVEGADVDQVNLAAPVADGQRLYIPRVGEVVAIDPGPVPGGGPAGTGEGPLDLNTADAGQLEALPGIGPATAAAILEERGRKGRFSSVEELLDVSGIGEAKLEDLRDLVRV